jgi:glycosyltransferase involved in cell wall biosynthesis
MNPKFILLEACDFRSHPVGGQLNYARLLLQLFGDQVATVGYALGEGEPLGVWFEKEDYGFTRMHFNLFRVDDERTNYLVPRRLLVYHYCRKYWNAILSLGCRYLYLQEHVALMAVRRKDWASICYRFPGVEGQLDKARYAWAKPLSRLFDYCFYRATRKADVLLASADANAIEEMRRKSFGYVKNREVVWFPTRVNTQDFYPRTGVTEVRAGQPLRFVSSGRLHWVKGWDLVLEALGLLKDKIDFTYTYVGDGPDREALLATAVELGIGGRVEIAGFVEPEAMAQYLRDADLYLMGSHMEGWPTTLVEAYVSGLPMVCTQVSGASAIIDSGTNGFICDSRDPVLYANAIERALELDPQTVLEVMDTDRYTVDNLMPDLADAWSAPNI